jgi:hypothetical protein
MEGAALLFAGERADNEEPIILAPPPAPSDPPGVDAPPNPANCLKQANQEEALRRCDFSDPELINELYPTYVGKGTFNCPLSWIDAAATKRGKARMILNWCMLTPKQQKEKLDAIYDNQLVLREGLVSGVLNVDRMLAQPSSCKKRRTLAKDRDLLGKFSGNEDEWVKVLRVQERQLECKERRNSKNREKTASQKKVSLVLFAFVAILCSMVSLCSSCLVYPLR